LLVAWSRPSQLLCGRLNGQYRLTRVLRSTAFAVWKFENFFDRLRASASLRFPIARAAAFRRGDRRRDARAGRVASRRYRAREMPLRLARVSSRASRPRLSVAVRDAFGASDASPTETKRSPSDLADARSPDRADPGAVDMCVRGFRPRPSVSVAVVVAAPDAADARRAAVESPPIGASAPRSPSPPPPPPPPPPSSPSVDAGDLMSLVAVSREARIRHAECIVEAALRRTTESESGGRRGGSAVACFLGGDAADDLEPCFAPRPSRFQPACVDDAVVMGDGDEENTREEEDIHRLAARGERRESDGSSR